MSSISTINLKKMLGQAFMRYSLVLSIVFVTGGLTVAILVLNNILTSPSLTTSTTNNNQTTIFDQTIMNRLSSYNYSATNSNYQNLSANARSPFFE